MAAVAKDEWPWVIHPACLYVSILQQARGSASSSQPRVDVIGFGNEVSAVWQIACPETILW